MKTVAFLLVVSAGAWLPSLASGQSFNQYLALRKQYGVVAAARPEALESFLGHRTLEIQGVVKGSFRVGSKAALMLETPDGGTVVVDTDAIPDWLLGNETPARLLVKASRESETSSFHADLVAAAPESQMHRYENDIEAKRLAAEAAAKKRQSERGGLSGPIGRNGSGLQGKSVKNWYLPASEATPMYASFIRHENPRLPDAEANRIAQAIVGFSLEYGVDARLIMAMVMVESDFNPGEVSSAGAIGLGQLMPGTAASLNVQDPRDSVDNLYGTVRLIRSHLDTYRQSTSTDFDALVLSLAAYNAGPGAVKRAGGVPNYRETQNYVRKVIQLYYQLAGTS